MQSSSEPKALREKYPLTFGDHSQEREKALSERQARAWKLAGHLADLLKGSFQAQRVVVFGSLARPGAYTPWSDLDIAAWGIPPHRYYAAVAAVTAESDEFKVDLIDPDDCRPSLRQAIEAEGIEL